MFKALWAGIKRAVGDERFEQFEITNFADHTVKAIYEKVIKEFTEVESDKTKQLLEEAKNARGTACRSARIRAACIYLGHAQILRTSIVEGHPPKPTGAEAYHYAANEFRHLDLLDRAAQCYFNSGVSALQASRNALESNAKEPLALALRSAGRAKALFASLGDEERSSRSHQLRQEIQRRGLQLERKLEWILLFVWKVVTGYGASTNRWFTALVFTLVTFAILYWAGLASDLIEIANNAPAFSIITPMYLSVLNLLQFGSYTQIVPMHWIVQIVLILHGVAAFVLVGTGITFLTKK